MRTDRILVIEGELVNGKLTVGLLSGQGYDVIWSRSYADGVEIAVNQQPEFILADASSEKEDVHVYLKQLASLPATRDIPVIAMFADLDIRKNCEALAAGCVGCIKKRCPYAWMPWSYTDPLAFLEVLREIINTCRREKVNSNPHAPSRGEVRSGRLFEEALRTLQKGYPAGTILQLSNGSIGRVCEDVRDPGRPVVDLVLDKSGNHPQEPLKVDLSATDNVLLRIKRVCAQEAC